MYQARLGGSSVIFNDEIHKMYFTLFSLTSIDVVELGMALRHLLHNLALVDGKNFHREFQRVVGCYLMLRSLSKRSCMRELSAGV
jgi:hypothetical protein